MEDLHLQDTERKKKKKKVYCRSRKGGAAVCPVDLVMHQAAEQEPKAWEHTLIWCPAPGGLASNRGAGHQPAHFARVHL